MVTRPSKDEYYLLIAKQVAQRGTCLRRRYGAIIVNNDQIISTGYVGAPRGAANCIDINKCLRKELNVPKGERYELCRSVHAEMNAIINAARSGVSVFGGTMFMHGEEVENGSYTMPQPCKLCTRAIINAGIKEVVMKMSDGSIKHINVSELIEKQ